MVSADNGQCDVSVQATERQFIIKENIRLRTTGISMKKANVLQTKPFPVNFFIHSLIIYWNTRRKNVKIILASASPRRKEVLEQLGLTFLVFPAQGEEKQVVQMVLQAFL